MVSEREIYDLNYKYIYLIVLQFILFISDYELYIIPLSENL